MPVKRDGFILVLVVFLCAAFDASSAQFFGDHKETDNQNIDYTYAESGMANEDINDIEWTLAFCGAIVAGCCCGLCGFILTLIYIRRMVRQHMGHMTQTDASAKCRKCKAYEGGDQKTIKSTEIKATEKHV